MWVKLVGEVLKFNAICRIAILQLSAYALTMQSKNLGVRGIKNAMEYKSEIKVSILWIGNGGGEGTTFTYFLQKKS